MTAKGLNINSPLHMNTLTRAFAETFQGAWYRSPVEVLATPSTRRITLQPASQELTLPRTARGKKGRHARNTDSEDNLQADGEAVKKVTVHGSIHFAESRHDREDTSRRTVARRRTSAVSRARLNEAFTWSQKRAATRSLCQAQLDYCRQRPNLGPEATHSG